MNATTNDKNAIAVLYAFAATDSLAGDSLPIDEFFAEAELRWPARPTRLGR